jgi:hypothetical protein
MRLLAWVDLVGRRRAVGVPTGFLAGVVLNIAMYVGGRRQVTAGGILCHSSREAPPLSIYQHLRMAEPLAKPGQPQTADQWRRLRGSLPEALL